MTRYLIICILIAAAGCCNATMDKLQFHYSTSIFPKKGETLLGKPHEWWNPDVSWRNKYKNYPEDKRPAFPGAMTALVFLTDAWHLFKFLMLALLSAAAGMTQKKPWHIARAALIAYVLFTGAFMIVFRVL